MNKYSIFGSLSCILIGLYLPSFLKYTATVVVITIMVTYIFLNTEEFFGSDDDNEN